MSILYDVYVASKLIDGERVENYDRLYYSTNENLEELFKYIDVSDKDVLTVLSSSDQYFYCCFNNARSVDSYDINNLTKYYYYLRLWGIKYLDLFYPSEDLFKNHIYIYELLKLVECESESEKEAYMFWNNYIRNVFPFDNRNLFYVGTKNKGIVDPTKLIESIRKNKFNFYNSDLKNINIDKKYDVIITSNILEYCSGDTTRIIRDKLDSLLNEDGIIVCSNIMYRYNSGNGIFREKFNCSELPYYDNYPLGYVYKKKC